MLSPYLSSYIPLCGISAVNRMNRTVKPPYSGEVRGRNGTVSILQLFFALLACPTGPRYLSETLRKIVMHIAQALPWLGLAFHAIYNSVSQPIK